MGKRTVIFGMMTIRDEEDTLQEAVDYVASLVDALIVVDCGSIDNSRKLIELSCKKHSNIISLPPLEAMHARQVRRHIWSQISPKIGFSHWWMIADADEFVDPEIGAIVARADTTSADHIFSKHANFYFTKTELHKWKSEGESLRDRVRPISDRRRYYRMHTSQIRLFRHRPWLRWNNDTSFPSNLSEPFTEQILFRHYQYRDPVQIERRLQIRSSWAADSDLMKDNPHWLETEVEKKVSDERDLLFWDGQSSLIADPELPTAPSPRKWKSILKQIRARLFAMTQVNQSGELFKDESLASRVHEVIAKGK